MVQVLIGQGADLNIADKVGEVVGGRWTRGSSGGLDCSPLRCQRWLPGRGQTAGGERRLGGGDTTILNILTPFLLLRLLAVTQDETKNGRVALWYAASEGHNAVLYFLLREKHKSYSLLEDRRVSRNTTTLAQEGDTQIWCVTPQTPFSA